jgi:hypothetical protein
MNGQQRRMNLTWHQRLRPIILATCEAEIRRIVVKEQQGK